MVLVLLPCSSSLSLYTACPAAVQVENAVITAWPAETPGDVMVQKVDMEQELVWIFSPSIFREDNTLKRMQN